MKIGVIRHATVISPDVEKSEQMVMIEDSRIAAIKPEGKPLPKRVDWSYNAAGQYVVPGFIDIHTHGALGRDVTDVDDPQAIFEISRAKQEEGCTLFCPTTLTLAFDALAAALRNVAAYRASTAQTCRVQGVHLEGPFINPACCGAQNPAFVRKADWGEVEKLGKIVPITEVTYAAEMPGAAEFTRALKKHHIVASCGHSKATHADFMAAHKNGLNHLTHFCNQMSPLHHREIGLVGTGFLEKDVHIELICDKVHVCADMLKLIFSVKDPSTIFMITDSMRASHLPDGPSSIGGLDVIVKNGEARLASNGALAGSMLRMNVALKNIFELTGLPLSKLIRCTSWNQALELGIGDREGKVEKGFNADLALLKKKSFAVVGVVNQGELRKF